MLGRSVASAAVLVAVLAVGCGSKDDKTSARTQPQQQCDDLVEHWCSHALDCAVQGGLVTASDEPHQHDICYSTADGTCDNALAVTSSYDACMSAIDSDDCDTINAGIQSGDAALPDVCMGVIEE